MYALSQRLSNGKGYKFRALIFRFSANVQPSPTDGFMLLTQLLNSVGFWFKDLEIDPRNYITQFIFCKMIEAFHCRIKRALNFANWMYFYSWSISNKIVLLEVFL